MDRMPNAELAFVEETKVVDYLLAHRQRTGQGGFLRSVRIRFGPLGGPGTCAARSRQGGHPRAFLPDSLRCTIRGRGQAKDALGQAPVLEGCLARGSLRKTARAASYNRGVLVRRRREAMIKEHEEVVLRRDLPEDGLEAGDVGTVIAVHEDERGRPPATPWRSSASPARRWP